MNKYNQLFQEIFKQPLAHDGNVALLEKTISNYPYFTPAHFFLLHLTDNASPAFAEQAKKTTSLFNNTYWLNFQLLELEMEVSNQPPVLEESIETKEADTVELIGEKPESTFVNEEVATTPYSAENVIIKDADGDNVEYLTSSFLTPEVAIPESTLIEEVEPTAIITAQTIPEIHEPLDLPSDNSFTASGEPGSSVIEGTPMAETAMEAEPVTDTPDTFAEEVPAYSEAEMDAHEALQNETDLPEDIPVEEDTEMEQVSLKMAETLAGLTLDRTTTEETISFEPLHASDYFASVGIRLSEEIKPADKLGLQLRSFTEWLKTMKKFHAEQLGDNSTSETSQEKSDKTIQAMAEASNKENDVLTEAMADVFEQQGKTGKAIEVYEKLSLLNPSKKVYFAAKINQLKD